MNFLNHTFAYEDLRDCTLITRNGIKIVVNIDSIEFSGDALPKFEGHTMGIEKAEPRLSYVDYSRYYKMNYIPEIKNVIFNDPATIVFWEDGTKTVVKCQDGDEFDPEKGLAMAIVKKTYGNKGSYCNKLKKWLPKEEPDDTNHSIFVPKEFTLNVDIDKLSKSFMKGIRDGIGSIFNGTKCTSNGNGVSSKKRMTFREEEAKLHPENVNPIYIGGVLGCPRDIKACGHNLEVSDDDCRACWDRVIPDESMGND